MRSPEFLKVEKLFWLQLLKELQKERICLVVSDFEDKERGHEPRDQVPSEVVKCKEMDCPLESPERSTALLTP